jgi:DNA topoisomerase-6 subunit B
MAPPTGCLAPIGAEALLAGLLKGIRAEFYTASVRPPAVYRGNPFQIEVAFAWGGDIGKGNEDSQAKVIRFANRVPLLHQPGSCCAHKAVTEIRWSNYGLSQSKNALPSAPIIILVHMASVWVPYISEGKEAIADYDEIRKEMKLALGECGRRLSRLLKRKKNKARHKERRDAFRRYIGEVTEAVYSMLPNTNKGKLEESLVKMARKYTQRADEEYDEHGHIVQKNDLELPDTIVVEESESC